MRSAGLNLHAVGSPMSTGTHPTLGTVTRVPVHTLERGAPDPRGVLWHDRWLAARVQQTIAPAAVRLELWDRSSPYASPQPPVGDLVVHDRRTLAGLAVNPDLWFGEAYMAGRLDVRGPLEPVVEALSRLSLTPSWRARAGQDDCHPQLAAGGARQRSPSLRPRQQLLPAVARPGAGLHLRLLRTARAVTR